MIVIDTKEASKTNIKSLLEQDNILFECAPLEVGDFVVYGIEDKWIIERKTVAVFHLADNSNAVVFSFCPMPP